MTRRRKAALIASVLAVVTIHHAEAKAVRGTESCSATKEARTIKGTDYMCTKCTTPVHDEVNGELTNFRNEIVYKDCEEKAARGMKGSVGDIRQPSAGTLDPGPKKPPRRLERAPLNPILKQ